MKRGEYKAECAREFMGILLESGVKQPDVMDIDIKRMAQYAVDAAENLTALLYEGGQRIALTENEITDAEKKVLESTLEMTVVSLLQRERTQGNRNLVTKTQNCLVYYFGNELKLKDVALKQESEYTSLSGFGRGCKILMRDMLAKYGLHFGMSKKEVTLLVGVDLWTGSPVYPDMEE